MVYAKHWDPYRRRDESLLSQYEASPEELQRREAENEEQGEEEDEPKLFQILFP